MADTVSSDVQPLLEAIALAARAHRGQLRKDGQTPYASHAFRVCMVLRHVFEIDDPPALLAAALHDTIEDTTVDFDDLEAQFGKDVAQWVALLSKDKRLPEPEREGAYVENLARAPWQVKVCKLADVFDNLMDAPHSPPQNRARVYQNAHRYLDGLKPNMPEQARRPWQLVSALLAEMEAGETHRKA